MKFKDHAKQAGFDMDSPPEIFFTPDMRKTGYDGLVGVDLFAGCGGASCGFHQAGIHVAVAVEKDHWCMITYMANLGKNADKPVCFIREDIRNISAIDITDALIRMGYSPIVDVLWMSPPCQGFSSANMKPAESRASFDFGSNYCMLESIRILKELRPKSFVFENVPGLNQGKLKPLWEEWQRLVKKAGYDFKWEILDAANYGVPQHRKRIIGIGLEKLVISIDDNNNAMWPIRTFENFKENCIIPGDVEIEN